MTVIIFHLLLYCKRSPLVCPSVILRSVLQQELHHVAKVVLFTVTCRYHEWSPTLGISCVNIAAVLEQQSHNVKI